MAKKEFSYRGKSLDDLRKLSIGEFAKLLPARQRRTLNRGMTEAQKTFLENLRKSQGEVKTHCRDMVIVPEMVGRIVGIYNGKEFFKVTIMEEMIGHCLGELSLTRKRIEHSAPGIGATKSSASLSVK